MNLRSLVGAASLGAVSYLQPFRPFVVSGVSMSPTLADRQWIVGMAHPREISRGEVVVFRRGGETMVKRVALLPGDRFERYLVVDQWVSPSNPLSREAMVRGHYPRRDETVPEGHLFVVGDNYYESVDSRTYGPVPLDDVIAVVPNVAPSTDGWYAPSHLTGAVAATF